MTPAVHRTNFIPKDITLESFKTYILIPFIIPRSIYL